MHGYPAPVGDKSLFVAGDGKEPDCQTILPDLRPVGVEPGLSAAQGRDGQGQGDGAIAALRQVVTVDGQDVAPQEKNCVSRIGWQKTL